MQLRYAGLTNRTARRRTGRPESSEIRRHWPARPGFRRLLRISRLIACAGALAIATPGLATQGLARSAPTASAQAFVEHIYDAYTGRHGSAGVPLDGSAEVRKLFDPPLATLILADRAKSARLDEPAALDGDPFVDAQDWALKNLRIRVAASGPAAATADVGFDNLDQKVHLRIDLVLLDGGWRITEIHYLDTNTTLSGILQYY